MYKGDKNKFGATGLAMMEARKSRTYVKTPDSVKDNMGKGGEMEGHVLYGSYCSGCHQQNGKGDNGRYPPLAGSEWVTGDRDRLIRILLYGLQGEIKVDGKTYNGIMPAHGSFLDDHAIASILTYLQVRFNKAKNPFASAEVTRLRKK